MNATNGRALAGIGAVLAIVGIFLDAFVSTSYWDVDGTFAWFGLIAGALALLLVAASYAGNAMDGWLFAVGAVLLGYWGFFPATFAFDQWDQTGAGLWLCFAGGALITIGAAVALVSTGVARTTPAGGSMPALAAGLGVVLLFPAIFLDADQGDPYWNAQGHSLGIVMLALAVVAALLWAATYMGQATRGLDSAVTLVLLGLFAADPVGAAFNQFGTLDTGAWLGLAGGILAAGGTWAARGAEMPRTAAAAA